jgi:acetylornithine deacetylase/succinyl-diaminopimelate desuccinylase-like protein
VGVPVGFLFSEVAHLPQYASMFVIGVLAYRGQWLGSMPVVAEVRAAVERVRARRHDLQADVRMIRFAPPMETAAETPGVEAIRTATAEVLGQDPGVHGWSAFSDANILVGEAATPTIVFGPGSIAPQAHRPNESVGIDELVAAAKIYALTISRLLG